MKVWSSGGQVATCVEWWSFCCVIRIHHLTEIECGESGWNEDATVRWLAVLADHNAFVKVKVKKVKDRICRSCELFVCLMLLLVFDFGV